MLAGRPPSDGVLRRGHAHWGHVEALAETDEAEVEVEARRRMEAVLALLLVHCCQRQLHQTFARPLLAYTR